MEKKIRWVLIVLCAVLVLPLLAAAQNKVFEPEPKLEPIEVRPIDDNVKLRVINKARRKNKSPEVASGPPPHVTLSPASPHVGLHNSLIVQGVYNGAKGAESIIFKGKQDHLVLYFATVQGKTYLLDASTALASSWSYSVISQVGTTVSQGTLAAQDGHILIPFVAPGALILVNLSPAVTSNAPNVITGRFLSAELTKVD